MDRRVFVAGAAAAAAASSAQAASRPNILFLFPDQLRWDWVEPSVAGLPVRTPHVKALAERGTRFTQAFTPSPLCAPARACLASTRKYERCGVPSNAVNYPLAQTTFYAMLRASGYHVMGCGKFDFHKPDRDWGLDGKRLIREWGFSDGIDNEGKHDGTGSYHTSGRPMGPYLAYLEKLGLAKAHVADFESRKGHNATFVTPLSDEVYCDNWIARNGLGLIDAAPKGQPWFLQVNFNGPHNPWDITASMEKRWRGVKFPQPNRPAQFSPGEHELIRQNYAAMVENIDRNVGLFIDKLRQRGELDNTLIVFSSDHGEMLGDHGLWGKTKPHQGSAAVPLVVAGLGVKKKRAVAQPVSTLDLPATFLDFAGVERPPAMDSRSLRAVLTRGATVTTPVTSALGPWKIAVADRYKYVEGYAKEPLLFDLKNDPRENENVAALKPALVKDLRAALG